MTIALVRDRALSHFADNVVAVHARSLRQVWIISPWITTTASFYALNTTLSVVQSSRAALTVITRFPDKPNHRAALKAVEAVPQAQLFLLSSLHAKLYLVDCDGVRIALVGSANFTQEGESEWLEIVADVRSSRSSDPAATFIHDLFAFAMELTTHPAAHRTKSRAAGWWHSRALNREGTRDAADHV